MRNIGIGPTAWHTGVPSAGSDITREPTFGARCRHHMIEGIHGHLLVIHRRDLSKSIILIDHLIPERRMNMGFRGRVVVVAAKRLLISTRHFLDNFATIKTSSVFVLLRRGFNRW